MQQHAFSRVYVLLRPARGAGCGFARLESQGKAGRVVLHVSQLPPECRALRILLLSGDAATGAVIDLGLMRVTADGQGRLNRDAVAFPTAEGVRAFHSLLLATDWPDGDLMLYGTLVVPPPYPLWQLEDALHRYLTVPPTGQVQAQPEHPAPQPEDVPEAPPLSFAPLIACAPRGRMLARSPVRLLPQRIWPEAIAELQPYFDSLMPFAPFDAPGWRFVQVPLPEGSPGAWCAVGVRCRGGDILQVAYAIPGRQEALPPGGLHGYRWQQGRNGQGYWVLAQGFRP